MTERIDTAAIKYEGKVYTLPRPNRHWKIIAHIVRELRIPHIRGEIQGFVTDAGRFVDRTKAMKIARDAGQILSEPTFQPDVLFSEDVW